MSQTTWGTLHPVAYPAHDGANYMVTWDIYYDTHTEAYPTPQTMWDMPSLPNVTNFMGQSPEGSNTSDLCIDFPNFVKWHERWTIQEETFSENRPKKHWLQIL